MWPFRKRPQVGSAVAGLVLMVMSMGQQSAGKEMGPSSMNIEWRMG